MQFAAPRAGITTGLSSFRDEAGHSVLEKRIRTGARLISMHKAIRYARFDSERVISDDPWLFVELWLKRNHTDNNRKDALAHWIQARRFADAAKMMGIESAPLATYYSFLNATKALLIVRGQQYGQTHGVSGDRLDKAKASLSNESVHFKSGGVLPALCSYLGDSPTSREYSLKDLLWNLPFVHRAFTHTFTSAPKLFFPLTGPQYVTRADTSKAWFQAKVAQSFADKRLLRQVPSSFEIRHDGSDFLARRTKRFQWFRGRPDKKEKALALVRLGNYHASLRRVLLPISGDIDRWYLKKSIASNTLAERHALSITFAAMHRLSELARYDPKGFERHLCGSSNWLLTEFIEHSPRQFIDQIASEITGFQISPVRQ